MARHSTFIACALVAASLALAGCLGNGEDRDPHARGKVVTVHASLPRHGVSAAAARAVEDGARLALADAGGRSGGLPVRLVVHSSTGPDERVWDPALVSRNAELAADDPGAVAYLGELDYGASAISLPITNEARMLQVSPADGLTSLTRTPPGRPRSNPERLRPAGEPSFVRLIPSDLLQAEAILKLARAGGARRLVLVFDEGVYGRELAAQLVARARREGPDAVRDAEYRGEPADVSGIAADLAEAHPDAVVYAGVAGPGTGPLLAAIDRRMPGVPLYATHGALARDPGMPIPAAPERVQAVTPLLPPDALDAAARRIVARVAVRNGPAGARPEAVYGYEAMRLVLDAVAVGGRDRERVIETALRARRRESALGPLRIRRTGDVDDRRFALYELHDGTFEFDRIMR